MKIVVMEPLGVKMEQINALAAPLQVVLGLPVRQVPLQRHYPARWPIKSARDE